MKFKQYVVNVLIGFDQFVNTLWCGYPDETLSSRAHRTQNASAFWKLMRKVVDGLFFFQKNHCHAAYRSEVLRRHINLEIKEK